MEKPSTARIALKWGLVTAILIIIYTVIFYMAALFKTPALSWIGFLLLLVGIFMALREFKSLNGGYMSFSEGLGLGTLMCAVTGFIASIFSYVYTNFIDTTILQQMNDLQRNEMEARGLSSEQIDQAMEMIAKFATPSISFLIGILLYVIFGFIFSLIASAIVKNSKPEVEF